MYIYTIEAINIIIIANANLIISSQVIAYCLPRVHCSTFCLPSTVNLANFPPDITLNTFIREHAQLTATKFMCLEGGCGVCVCVVRDGKRTWAVNSVSVGITYLMLALYTH